MERKNAAAVAAASTAGGGGGGGGGGDGGGGTRTNLDASLVGCQVDTCHYGLLLEEWRARVDCVQTIFTDVARPVMVARTAPFKVTVHKSLFV